MGICVENCVGGHYVDPYATNAICPTNAKESHGGETSPTPRINTTALFGEQVDWVMANVGDSIGPKPLLTSKIILDTDLIYTLINKINSEIDRYDAGPRYDENGKVPFLGGSKIRTDINYDQSLILSSTWVNIVKKVLALEAARAEYSDLSISPVDIQDGEDIITSEFLLNIINSINNVAGNTACGVVCKCNIVCNCNGNCGCNYSDMQLKENIEKINYHYISTNLAENLNKVNLYSYNYNNNISNLPTDKQYGVMAQELMQNPFFTSMVSFNSESGYYQVDYTKFIPHLINGYQVLNQENNALKNEIEKLHEKFDNLLQHITPY
jgi:hypothetical protein